MTSKSNEQYSKFLSLSNFDYVLTIIKNRQAYFADASQLNDPLETINAGDLAIGHWQNLGDLQSLTGATRSFCLTRPKSIEATSLMWAHYGDGFKGIQIKFKRTGKSSHSFIDVRYEPIENIRRHLKLPTNSNCVSDIIKGNWWSYENETRIVSLNHIKQIEHFVSIDKLGLEIECVCITERTKEQKNFTLLEQYCLLEGIPLVTWDYLNEFNF